MGKLFELSSGKLQKNIVNKVSEKVSEILIYDQIGGDWFGEGITGKTISAALKAIPSDHTIHLRVNSPGGSVFEGTTIYELLKQDKRKVKCFIDGIAASISSIIPLAADEIVMGEASMFMLHKPLVGVYGNAMELERMINILDKIEEQMIGIYSRKTKMSRVQIATMLEKETFLTAQESVDMGLADSIVEGDSEQLRVAASMIQNSSWIKDKSSVKQLSALDKQRIVSFKSSIGKFLDTRK